MGTHTIRIILYSTTTTKLGQFAFYPTLTGSVIRLNCALIKYLYKSYIVYKEAQSDMEFYVKCPQVAYGPSYNHA